MNSFYFAVHILPFGKLSTIAEYENFMRVVNFTNAVKAKNLESDIYKKHKVQIFKAFTSIKSDHGDMLYEFYVDNFEEVKRLALGVN